MNYHEINLIQTAAREDQWPASDLPELVFAGRSNAGKSSLINALVNRSRAAYQGKTPGKTRLLNFFAVDGRVVFADAPGYGYASGIRMAAESFRRLMEPYFQRRSQLKGMILVLDIRRVPNEDDLTMIQYARSRHLPIIVACTKSDKLSRSQQIQSLKTIQTALNINAYSTVACSALKKEGMDELWQRIDALLQQGSQE